MTKRKGKKKKPQPKVARADLDELLAERYHGASNISGIRYQVLFSVLKSFELYDLNPPDASIRLEGIEDVDLLGFQFGSKFIQAKNYQKNFTWSLLDDLFRIFSRSIRPTLQAPSFWSWEGRWGKGLRQLTIFRTSKEQSSSI